MYKRCKDLEYQLCLSTTPYRAKTLVQNLKLQAWSGDIVYTITESKLRERGVLSDYKVFMFMVDHNDIDYEDPIDDDDYADCRKKLIFENNFRNEVLKKVIDSLRDMNLKTLVLFQSVEHGRAMSKILGEQFISGATKSHEREQAKREFLDREGGVLLASNIFKKGVTLPEVQVIINADEGVEDANTIQKKGRVLGATATKKRSLVIDFFDIYDAYFSEHSTTRLNTYIRSIGKKRIGILDVSAEGWLETFCKWTSNWFELNERS
jgi:superfamily II DNA or RNA helicase